jgi:hypothetical protein
MYAYKIDLIFLKEPKNFFQFLYILINVFITKIKIEIIIMTYRQSIILLRQPKNLIF